MSTNGYLILLSIYINELEIAERIMSEINFGFKSTGRMSLIMQTEATECGLACIAMIANYFGYRTTLSLLRKRFKLSMRGSTLKDLLMISEKIHFGSRPLTLPLDELSDLKLPCILHWKFNHFVVLNKANSNKIEIYDPAAGIKVLSLSEASRHFTGIAVELWAEPEFTRNDERKQVNVSNLFGKTRGIIGAAAQIVILAAILEFLQALSPLFMQWVLDKVILTADKNLLAMLAVGFFILLLMQQLINVTRTWAIMYFSTTFNLQWKSNIFSHLLKLPLDYFQRRHLGDIVSRFGSLDQIQKTLSAAFLAGILDGVMSFGIFGILFFYHPTIALIILGTLSLYVASRHLWYGSFRRASEDQLVHSARQQTHFLETVRGIKPLKLFQRETIRRASWIGLLSDQINSDVHVQKLTMLYKLSNAMLFGIENIVVIWIGALLVIDNVMSPGSLIALLAYKSLFETKVSSFVDNLYDLKMLRLQGERLADIVLAEPENFVEKNHDTIENVRAEITLSNVFFRYADSEPYILRDLNIKIHEGESVAIIGPSGCGKSTLANILSGTSRISSGKIYVGESEIEKIGFDALRSIIGVVNQEDTLFAGSIAENISFFDPEMEFNFVQECADIASISTEISSMPMGYNTLVGDMGTVLSGGQKQRILLARALYKRPKIIILDEATSHLDLPRERDVSAKIKSLAITRIIIAHRPETIASADRVISLINGGAVEMPKSATIISIPRA